MRYLVLLLIPMFFACGREPNSQLKSFAASPRDYWQEIAPMCAGYPAKANCDDGDMLLFGGLLCAAGDQRGCSLVRDSQSPDGQWWRSPRRNPGNAGSGSSFSRDMAMGVLVYLQTTRDRDAAQRWLDWLENNRPCAVEKAWGGCLVRGPHRFCRDDKNFTCSVTPGNWSLMGRVWDELGLERNAEMHAYAKLDSDALLIQAQTATVGYQLHLLGVEVWLKQRLEVDPDKRSQSAAILLKRQPDNPFFAYLSGGPKPRLQERLLRLCPHAGGPASDRSQWSWERDTADLAWRDSMGWDCLFLSDVLSR